MRIILLELQNNADGTCVIGKPTTFTDRNKAESEYHKLLQYAAVSGAASKGCMLFTSEGEVLRAEFYHHETEPEPEPETQEETPAE